MPALKGGHPDDPPLFHYKVSALDTSLSPLGAATNLTLCAAGIYRSLSGRLGPDAAADLPPFGLLVAVGLEALRHFRNCPHRGRGTTTGWVLDEMRRFCEVWRGQRPDGIYTWKRYWLLDPLRRGAGLDTCRLESSRKAQQDLLFLAARQMHHDLYPNEGDPCRGSATMSDAIPAVRTSETFYARALEMLSPPPAARAEGSAASCSSPPPPAAPTTSPPSSSAAKSSTPPRSSAPTSSNTRPAGGSRSSSKAAPAGATG